VHGACRAFVACVRVCAPLLGNEWVHCIDYHMYGMLFEQGIRDGQHHQNSATLYVKPNSLLPLTTTSHLADCPCIAPAPATCSGHTSSGGNSLRLSTCYLRQSDGLMEPTVVIQASQPLPHIDAAAAAAVAAAADDAAAVGAGSRGAFRRALHPLSEQASGPNRGAPPSSAVVGTTWPQLPGGSAAAGTGKLLGSAGPSARYQPHEVCVCVGGLTSLCESIR
jgi:hypothetical protein